MNVVAEKMETALDGNQDRDTIFCKENPLYGADMNFSSSGRYDFQTAGKYHTSKSVPGSSTSPELPDVTPVIPLMKLKCSG